MKGIDFPTLWRSSAKAVIENCVLRSVVRSLFPRLAGIVSFLLIWQWLSASNIIDARILAPPSQLIVTLQEMARTGELGLHVLSSVKRVLIGFFIASCSGVSLGLILGSSGRTANYWTPIIELLRPIPPIAWIPLAILWFGIGDRPSFFIVALGAFFPIFVNAFKGIRSVHPSLILAAKSLGADRKLLLTDVLVPAALPYIMTGLRVGLGIAWTSVIAAELVGAQSGLGYMIQTNRILLRTDKIVVGMILIGTIGLIMNQAMIALDHRWLKWQQEDEDGL